MSELSSRTRAGLIVVLILAALRFVIVPVVERQAEWRASIERQQQALTRLQRHQTGANERGARLASLKAEVAALDARYARAEDPARLQLRAQQRLEALAKKYDLVVRSTSWKPPVPGSPGQAPLQLYLLGPWSGIESFISAVEQLPELHQLREISFAADQLRGYGAGLVEVVVYYLEPEPKPAAAAAEEA